MKTDNFPKWFYENATVSDFEAGLAEFKGKKKLKFLQIGVFTGNASAWLLENILTDPTSILVDIDPWCGNLPHESVYDWDDIQEAYKEQVEPYGKKVQSVKAYSGDWLKEHREGGFDFIYIDGSHDYKDVLYDLTQSLKLINNGGLIALDDYFHKDNFGGSYGVNKAVAEVCKLNNLVFKVYPNAHGMVRINL